ncbi:MAG: hypothetical protein GTN67_14760 [Hydrotalea flava]|uniref:hypothetical protein n=1 Tax=Hydrotalea TaxID=1004300 RepID=UPI0015CF576F|nr:MULTISPECIES: hypothetical protein [Hydrotalea]MBY0349048.1 hypothetical protein [Hydrotalea flava]NIM36539.1 hypothetical protein [Hydrotalea flava]NIM39398.1 hypothetical protein [Hydrotalea flava]NIN04587.1 hypothetical protein [Hydrotalea flava]NIN16259.1 hypothetical protein [Hydrotalea flava]
MIQECRMSGPEHEALHHWLEPLINESNTLISITDTTLAKNTFDKIDKHLDVYRYYFK